MAHLKIRTFKDGRTSPKTTYTVSLAAIGYVKRLMPKKWFEHLREKGIDIDADVIVEMSRDETIRGTIVEVENHEKNERIVIAIE
jgi:hypothetical protein